MNQVNFFFNDNNRFYEHLFSNEFYYEEEEDKKDKKDKKDTKGTGNERFKIRQQYFNFFIENSFDLIYQPSAR